LQTRYADVEADRRQDTADPQCLDSHSICTVSGMFQNMSTSTLSPLVSWSNIASFVVERCAVHEQLIYGRWNFHGVVFQPSTSNSYSLCLAFRDDSTSLFTLRFLCLPFPSSRIQEQASQHHETSKAHTPRHPHGRSVIITLW
jgi:hypothetical protein